MTRKYHPLVDLEIDEDVISHDIASRLAFRLSQDVLFLKSQIPLPFSQLAKMKLHSKVDRKRLALLESLDCLSSHLATTFPAISLAFTRRLLNGDETQEIGSGKVHIMYVLGPSIGMPRARFVCEFSKLEVDRDLWLGKEEEERYSSDETEDTEEEKECSEDDESAPTPPRSPSPASSSGSRSPSPQLTSNSDEPSTLSTAPLPQPNSYTLNADGRVLAMPMPPPSRETLLRRTEHLLSRTLSCSEELREMAQELSATQMSILLRAPREFSHPAWRPLQAQSISLDKQLREFLTFPPKTILGVKKNTQPILTPKIKMQGIRILCRGDITELTKNPDGEDATLPTEWDAQFDEGKDMIWWQWSEKIVGFTDW